MEIMDSPRSAVLLFLLLFSFCASLCSAQLFFGAAEEMPNRPPLFDRSAVQLLPKALLLPPPRTSRFNTECFFTPVNCHQLIRNEVTVGRGKEEILNALKNQRIGGIMSGRTSGGAAKWRGQRKKFT